MEAVLNKEPNQQTSRGFVVPRPFKGQGTRVVAP